MHAIIQQDTDMQKASHNKFVYKNDHGDWEILFVVLLTLALFAFIIYGNRYFDGRGEVRTPDDHNQIQQLIDGSHTLEEDLRKYEENADFNENEDKR